MASSRYTGWRGSHSFLVVLLLLSGCGGGGLDAFGGAQHVLTAEETCAPVASNFGNGFFCATAQANLNRMTFADGSLGYCGVAGANLGLVGYSVTTFAGGAGLVTSQSEASDLSRTLGSQSPGYSRCTRL